VVQKDVIRPEGLFGETNRTRNRNMTLELLDYFAWEDFDRYSCDERGDMFNSIS
jgi:hypothetical protein